MNDLISQNKCPILEIPSPAKPSRCTFTLNSKPEDSPHRKIEITKKPKIMTNILQNVGQTPLVKLNKIVKDEDIKCDILVKCEYLNPGGSVKDRIALRMVEEAERRGDIKPGDTLIEPTSGNTGIGLALVSAVKGYRCIIVMPEKMSIEKVDVLRALGAEIVRTPTAAAFDSLESNISVAYRLKHEIPNSYILNQYTNPNNPLAHYDGTAEEILEACDYKLDMVVMSAGTGGTIDGISKKIKQKLPNCLVIGVDPYGSILAQPESLNKTDITYYDLEGIGYDFVPTVLNRNLVDKWYKVGDKDSFIMARRLIQEGLLCGGSSGCAVHAAIQAAREFNLPETAKVVVILPDSVRNYMTKFLSDEWMYDRHFMDKPMTNQSNDQLFERNISSLNLSAPITVQQNVTVQQAIELLKKEGFDQVPVVETDGTIMGMATLGLMMSMLMKKSLSLTDPISKAIYKNFQKVNLNSKISQLSRLLDIDHFVLVVHQQRQVAQNGTQELKEVIYGIITRIDLISYLIENHLNGEA